MVGVGKSPAFDQRNSGVSVAIAKLAPCYFGWDENQRLA
jgi:hypothetical protein